MIKEIINVFNEVDMLKGISETIYMIFFSTIIAYILGMPLGIFVVLTEKEGLLENKIINKILNLIINIGRSIPFIILILLLIPFTRLVIGKSYGSTASIVSLSIAAMFFVARVVEQSLKEVDKSLIETVVCMGASIKTIVFKVYLKESIPSLLRGVSLTIVNLIGYSAMAGAVGGGGLGDIAVRFGYYKYQTEVMIVTVIIIILLVEIIQFSFNVLTKKIDKTI